MLTSYSAGETLHNISEVQICFQSIEFLSGSLTFDFLNTAAKRSHTCAKGWYESITLQAHYDAISLDATRGADSEVLVFIQALLTKSLDKVQDNSLPAGLLDLKSFYYLPQVSQAAHTPK